MTSTTTVLIQNSKIQNSKSYTSDDGSTEEKSSKKKKKPGVIPYQIRTILVKKIPVSPKKKKEKEEQEQKRRTNWFYWLEKGKPLETGKIIMRDPVELGGIPRSCSYSTKAWWHNICNLPQSKILSEVCQPVLAISTWAFMLSMMHFLFKKHKPLYVRFLSIPVTCHSLMVSSIGLLLVFRTNSSYQRFSEGRKIWEHILNISRDLSRMSKLYEDEIGIEKRRRVQRLLAVFPYLLRHRIQPNTVMHLISDKERMRDPKHTLLLYDDKANNDQDEEAAIKANKEETTVGSRHTKPRQLYWVDKRTLPWRLLPSNAMEKCARAQNRPLWVVDRMSKELKTVPDSPTFTNRERLALLSHVDKLSATIGSCERIHQTVVPLNYARHALRSLTFWLITLPFCLVDSLGFATAPMIALISWILFGVYEIGTRIEDPFQGTLRLSILCDAIRKDVLADEFIRETAFKLHDDHDDEDDEEKDDNDDHVPSSSTTTTINNDELQFSTKNNDNNIVATLPKVIMTNTVVGSDIKNDFNNKNNTTMERIHS